jgi:diguanylate cyclase
MAYALTAIQQIGALKLPADPPSFHLWYTYATRILPALNQAINEALESRGRVSISELDELYSRHLSSTLLADRVESVGTELGDQVGHLVALVDVAIGAGDRYANELAGASAILGGSSTDRKSLRDVVDALHRATQSMIEQNRGLRASLSSSLKEIDELQAELKVICRDSLTDSLTSLANRKQFDQTLEIEIRRSSVSARPLSLLMCDVDNFKSFNDTFGHVMGDQALRLVASTMKPLIRDQDTLARYGGEEFVLILPGLALPQSKVLAERLRRVIGDKKVVNRSTGERIGQMTISIGVAQFRTGEAAREFLERADACLYQAKRAGRNCVVTEMQGKPESIMWAS